MHCLVYVIGLGRSARRFGIVTIDIRRSRWGPAAKIPGLGTRQGASSMSENRLPVYLDHILQAAADARSSGEGLAKDDFFTDKRTQQAVMKVMKNCVVFTQVALRGAVDKHARQSQSHGPRLFQHRPRCCMGDGLRMAGRFAKATARHAPECLP